MLAYANSCHGTKLFILANPIVLSTRWKRSRDSKLDLIMSAFSLFSTIVKTRQSRMFGFTSALVSGTFAANAKRGLAFADSSNTGDIAVAKNTRLPWVHY